jgi:sensor histidine kinase YesM
MDMCILFSNAVDNAVKACIAGNQTSPFLSLKTVQKGDFFMIDIENSRSDVFLPVSGTGIGLQSIKAVAEKYHGTVHIEKTPKTFRLNVLVLIPQHSGVISLHRS